jgi:hypothetical protein
MMPCGSSVENKHEAAHNYWYATEVCILLAMHTSGKVATARGHHPLLWQSCTVPRLHRPPQSPLGLGICRSMGFQQANKPCLCRKNKPSATVKHISSVAVMPLTNMKDGFSAVVRAWVVCAQSKTNEQTLQAFM